jgi:hypothetical protein
VLLSVEVNGSAKTSDVPLVLPLAYRPSVRLTGAITDGLFVVNINGNIEVTSTGNAEGSITYPVL